MSVSQESRARVLLRDRFKCTYCGRGVTWTSAEIDHVEPTSQGGSDEDTNLVTACVRCNQEKSGATPQQWFGSPEERAWTQFYVALAPKLAEMRMRRWAELTAARREVTEDSPAEAAELTHADLEQLRAEVEVYADGLASQADAMLKRWQARWGKR